MRRATSRLPLDFTFALLLHGAMAGEARAQEPPPPAPPPAAANPPPPAAAPDVAPPAPAMPPPPPPAAVVTPATPLPLPPTSPPPVTPPPPSDSSMRVGGAVRIGVKLQDPNQPKKMSELHLDTSGYSNAFELRLGGDVNKYFGWTANFNALLDGDGVGASVGGGTFADVSIEDLVAQFHPADEFNIWAGRLLVPSDRSNFSGPFFMSPWDYPGFYFAGAAPIGPMEGANGRNQGATVWGNVAEDKLKYFVGVYGIDQGGPNSTASANANPFYSARLSYTFQGAEPGYFGSSTYYGEKNIVTLGVSGQYQKDGSETATLTPKDTFIGMADLLAEENVPSAGTFTFEGQFYAFDSGYNFGGPKGVLAPKEAFYVLLSYLTPEPLGIGKLQPLVRLQQTIDPAWTIFDGALAYVIKEYDARLVATYEHIDTGSDGGKSNSLQFGIQLQK